MLGAFLLGLLAWASTAIADAHSLEGRILFNELCPGYGSLGQSKVVLDGGLHSGSIKRDGTFSIPDVDEGSYILQVIAHDYSFDTLRVDVHPASNLPLIHPYVPGTPHDPPSPVSLPYPIILTPRAKAVYFVEVQGFNALGMLSNPMVLMMGVMGVLVVGLPYLLKNLDPEMAKELNERQARVSSIQNAVHSGDFRGGLSALMADTEGSSSVDVSGSHAQAGSKPGAGTKGKSNKGGKRK